MDAKEEARALLRRIAETAQSALSRDDELETTLQSIASFVGDAVSPEAVATSRMDTNEARVLKNVLATIPYFVFWKNRNSRYLGCNEAFANAAGLSRPEAIIGKDDYDLPWKKEESDWFRVCDQRVMGSGQAELDIEETQLQADGRQRYVQTSKLPLRDANNEVFGVLGIYTDVTARKLLEQDLLHAKEAAEASAKAKADFLAVMSHELRTPLTLILSPIESLLRAPEAELGESTRHVLECVYRNAYRLKAMTDDILDFSKHEAGRLELDHEPLDVVAHVRQLVSDLEPAAATRGISLRLAGVDESSGIVMLDVSKLDKILINLVTNALKFAARGGNVVVEQRRVDEMLVFSVSDDGVGIDPRDHPRLFRRFEQLDSSSKRSQGGTGLGLSLVKVFVELMNGFVEVESELGRGATFTVQIPLVRGGGTAPVLRSMVELENRANVLETVVLPAAERARREAPLPAPRVLVVEDNVELREYLCALLAAEYSVVGAADGLSAYEAVRIEQPDVIVSDVMMPGLDGFELIAKLKAEPELATIPVLLLTARAGVEAAAESLNRGADDYLSKPFSPIDLVARVRAAHRMSALNRDLVAAERREALQRTQVALSELTRMASLGEMAAAIAHEVNQPLAGVSINAVTCSRWLAAKVPNLEEARAAADRIARDATRASDIVKRVRELFGRSTEQRTAVDLNEAAKEVLALAMDKLAANAATIHTELAGSLPQVQGDRVQLQQVLLNLVVNAAEAVRDVTDRPRVVVLRTSALLDAVRVEVEDSGVGVAPEHLERIFKAFHTTKPGGMGMGLSISRTIVENHGGKLGLLPKEGPGSSFYFSIPTT